MYSYKSVDFFMELWYYVVWIIKFTEAIMSKGNENKALFRTAMNGYKKSDVHAYIKSEDLRFVSVEREYIDRIESMTKTINELTAKIASADAEINRLSEENASVAALRSENAELHAQLDSAKNEISEKDAEIIKLREDIETLTKENTDAAEQLRAISANCELLTSRIMDSDNKVRDISNEVSRLNEENKELKEKISERPQCAQNTESHENEGYTLSDSEKKQISEMINRARSASEEMLKRAEAGAEIIIDKARSEVYSYRLKTFSAAKEVFNIATDDLRRSISVCMNDFVASMKSSKGDPARSAEAADVCDEDLSRRIERMQNDLDRAIADKLAEFDRKN